MNRRGFIASLPFLPAAVKAVAKAATATRMSGRSLWFLDWCDITPAAPVMLQTPWFQTARHTAIYSIEYLDVLDIAMGTPEPERKKAWHDRRKERSRQNIAYLKTQRPLPLP